MKGIGASGEHSLLCRDDLNEIDIGKLVRLPLDLRVTERRLQQTQCREPIRILGQHRRFQFLRKPFQSVHGLAILPPLPRQSIGTAPLKHSFSPSRSTHAANSSNLTRTCSVHPLRKGCDSPDNLCPSRPAQHRRAMASAIDFDTSARSGMIPAGFPAGSACFPAP